MHRGLWEFSPCGSCGGSGTFCGDCNMKGCIATPRSDLDVTELRDHWLRILAKHSKLPGELPHPVAELVAAVALIGSEARCEL